MNTNGVLKIGLVVWACSGMVRSIVYMFYPDKNISFFVFEILILSIAILVWLDLEEQSFRLKVLMIFIFLYGLVLLGGLILKINYFSQIALYFCVALTAWECICLFRRRTKEGLKVS